MKTTKKLIILIAVVLCSGLISTSVWAGSKQQHRWEGVAIGVGAVIVGSALINHHSYGYHNGPPVAFSFNHRTKHRYSARHHGYRKPHDGGHHNHWRPYDRGHQYKGHRQHEGRHGHQHRGKWQANDRRQHGDKMGRNRSHPGKRY